MILDQLDIDAGAFAAGTGWEIKPEGACKGDVCVPLPEDFDIATTAHRLGMAIVQDTERGLWALGPESITGRALVTAEAPELELDDIDGNPFRLSSLREQKVLVLAEGLWAELHPHGIDVTAVMPGATDTPGFAAALPPGLKPTRMMEPGDPAQVVDAALEGLGT